MRARGRAAAVGGAALTRARLKESTAPRACNRTSPSPSSGGAPTVPDLRLASASAAALAAAAASASGETKGLQAGTRSSSSECAKKQILRLQLEPSLQSWVRYLRRGGLWVVLGLCG